MIEVNETSVPGVEAAGGGGYGPPGGGGYGGPPGGYPPAGGGGGYGGPPGGPPPGGGGYGGGPPPGGYGGGPPGGAPPGGYGGPPPGGYGAPPGGGYGAPGFPAGGPKVHPLAIVSLVAGILSIPLCCCFFGFVLPIGAVACGFIALSQINKNPQAYSGAMLCYGGIACGGLGLVLTGLRFTVLSSEITRQLSKRRF